jgi:hypothetical protein
MTAEIIQFVPRPNPKRPVRLFNDEQTAAMLQVLTGAPYLPANFPTDCGNLGWPWSEDKA